MLLSMLAYLGVKSSLLSGDDSFTYASFLNKESKANTDYRAQISGVFIPLNEYIQRLANLDKLPMKTDCIGLVSGYEFALAGLSCEPMKIVSLFQLDEGSYRNLEFREIGKKIRILGSYDETADVYIQYSENIPYFTESDLVDLSESDGTVTDGNIDLYAEYGITNEMCAYCIEFIQGKLMETMAPEIANAHVLHAESYLNNVDVKTTGFYQNKVEAIHKI